MTEPTDLIERLRKQAEATSEISQQMAEDKSLRQDDNHERRTDLYMWLKPERTLEGRAADEITALRDRVAALEGALERILSWWPEGSESGRVGKGDAFAADIRDARSILSRAQQGGGEK